MQNNLFTALQHERPSKIESFDPFFAWPTCLLQNEGSCAHGFAWPKKKVPTKGHLAKKINKSYKNTARLQKHVLKMGLDIQFSYRNTVCKGPQAQPFGRENFDVHENDENELTIGLCFFEARWILSATQRLSAPRLCCGWPWLRFETRGCASSRRDEAQLRNFWLAVSGIFFIASL